MVDLLIDTSTVDPSLRERTVSKPWINSPDAVRAISASNSCAAFLRHDEGDDAAQDFGGRVLVQPLSRRIPARDRAIQRQANDSVGGIHDNRREVRVDQRAKQWLSDGASSLTITERADDVPPHPPFISQTCY